MPDYQVNWKIDVTADSPRSAARMARLMQDDESTATVFEVQQVIGERFGESVEVDLAVDDEPNERLVPDFVLDVGGEYGGNAYPEQVALRVGITVLGTGEDYGMTVETTGGDVVGSMTISRTEADGIMSMARIDHDLSGYEDDWAIPTGMIRTLQWVLPTDVDYEVVLTANQIDEVADWLDYATGTLTWDWAEQGEEWSV